MLKISPPWVPSSFRSANNLFSFKEIHQSSIVTARRLPLQTKILQQPVDYQTNTFVSLALKQVVAKSLFYCHASSSLQSTNCDHYHILFLKMEPLFDRDQMCSNQQWCISDVQFYPILVVHRRSQTRVAPLINGFKKSFFCNMDNEVACKIC